MFVNDDFIDLEIKTDYVPESGEDYLSVYIYANKYEDDDDYFKNPIEVGCLHFCILNPQSTKGIDTFILDSIALDYVGLYYFLERENPTKLEYMKKTNTAYVVDLKVDKEYRNKGIGSYMLKYLTNYLRYMKIKDLYLCSYPMDESIERSDIKKFERYKVKLDNFYFDNGFKYIGTYNDFKYMHKYIK